MKVFTKIVGVCLFMLTLSLTASAHDELFFKGLKNAYKLDPMSIHCDGVVKDNIK